MFKSGVFKDKYALESCNKPMHISYFYYSNVTSNNISCLSFHGPTSQLIQMLKDSSAKYAAWK